MEIDFVKDGLIMPLGGKDNPAISMQIVGKGSAGSLELIICKDDGFIGFETRACIDKDRLSELIEVLRRFHDSIPSNQKKGKNTKT